MLTPDGERLRVKARVVTDRSGPVSGSSPSCPPDRVFVRRGRLGLAAAVVLRLPEPMLARSDAIPAGRGWVFEPKLDGFRCLVCTHATFHARSRRGWEISHLLPELRGSLPKGVQLDGDLVALDETGRLDFHRLWSRMLHRGSRCFRRPRFRPVALLSNHSQSLRGDDRIHRSGLPDQPELRAQQPLVCAQCGVLGSPGAPSWIGCRTGEPGARAGRRVLLHHLLADGVRGAVAG